MVFWGPNISERGLGFGIVEMPDNYLLQFKLHSA